MVLKIFVKQGWNDEISFQLGNYFPEKIYGEIRGIYKIGVLQKQQKNVIHTNHHR